MTLVAAFLCDGIPIVVGDLVVSGPEKDGVVGIPSVGEASEVFPEGSGFAIRRVSQKIVVFSSDIVLGWAGDGVAVHHAVAGIREYVAKGQPVDPRSIEQLISRLSAEVRESGQGFQTVGFFRHAGKVFLYGHGARRFSSPILGDGCAAGSGSDALVNGEIRPIRPLSALAGSPPAAEFAVSKALALTGALLQLEIATHRSLRTFYGGGYELATLRENGFGKIGNVTLLFFRCSASRDGLALSGIELAMKIAYSDELLLIRTLRPTADGGLTDAVHGILAPAMPMPQLDKLPTPSMESSFLCTYVLVQSDLEDSFIYLSIDRSPTNSELFEYMFSDTPRIKIGVILLERIRKALHAHFERHGLRWYMAAH